MNIVITDLFFSFRTTVDFTFSINDGYEIEETFSISEFTKILCDFSDNNYSFVDSEFSTFVSIKDGKQIKEDEFEPIAMTVSGFVNDMYNNQYDYCKECLVKYLQSQNKN